MLERRWVVSRGVCAPSGGFSRSYRTMQGIDEIIPVAVYVPGCPPAPEALLAAIMKIQERIEKGEQAKAPQGAHRLGASGEGAIDRRARKQAWARGGGERPKQGPPPRGVVPLPAVPPPVTPPGLPRRNSPPPRPRP